MFSTASTIKSGIQEVKAQGFSVSENPTLIERGILLVPGALSCCDVLGEFGFQGVNKLTPVKSEESSLFSCACTDTASFESTPEIDAIFSSNDGSKPLVPFCGHEGSQDSSTWNYLFDDDVPIVGKTVETSTSSLSNSEGTFLPTPAMEEVSLKENSSRNGSVFVDYSVSLTSFQGQPSPHQSSNSITKPGMVDHLGVISYRRKHRSTPLAPVVPKFNDSVSLRRARNTEAARRSRARKLERMIQLEEKVDELLRQNSELENEVARLKALLYNKGNC